MKTQNRSGTRNWESLSGDSVHVSVSSTGRTDFQSVFPATATSKQIKLQALAFFGIEPGQADKYGLRYRGGDQLERQRIGKLGLSEVRLTLVRKEGSDRFGEALFLRRSG
jgi:hypothetical protein